MDAAAAGGTLQDCQRSRTAAAADIGNSIRRIQCERGNQRRVDGLDRGCEAVDLRAPFLAADAGPVGGGGALGHGHAAPGVTYQRVGADCARLAGLATSRDGTSVRDTDSLAPVSQTR